MRTLLCLAFVSSTAFAATPIDRAEAEDLRADAAGVYRLDTGMDVRLTVVDQQLYLDLNRHYRRQLHPVSSNLLSSSDGRLTVEYLPDGPFERIFIRHGGLPPNERLGERSWRGR